MAVSLGQLRDGLDHKLKSNENVDASLKSLQEQLDAYQAGTGSSFKKTLTTEEEASLGRWPRGTRSSGRKWAPSERRQGEPQVGPRGGSA